MQEQAVSRQRVYVLGVEPQRRSKLQHELLHFTFNLAWRHPVPQLWLPVVGALGYV